MFLGLTVRLSSANSSLFWAIFQLCIFFAYLLGLVVNKNIYLDRFVVSLSQAFKGFQPIEVSLCYSICSLAFRQPVLI